MIIINGMNLWEKKEKILNFVQLLLLLKEIAQRNEIDAQNKWYETNLFFNTMPKYETTSI